VSTTSWFPPLADAVPSDAQRATLIGRVWQPEVAGPTPVLIRDGLVHSLAGSYPTVSALAEVDHPAEAANAAAGEVLGTLQDIYANTPFDARDTRTPWLLAPHDLQSV
jgi:fumarylacetoacetate (FAA) hydrolase family protein